MAKAVGEERGRAMSRHETTRASPPPTTKVGLDLRALSVKVKKLSGVSLRSLSRFSRRR